MKPNRMVVTGAYAVGLLLIVLPMTEITLRLWPLELGTTAWRFGATGLLTNTLVTPLLGLLISGAVAFQQEHGRMIRVLSVAACLGGLFLVALSGLYVLDAAEMRTQVTPEGLFVFDVTAIQAITKLGVILLIAFTLGIGAWRSASAARTRSRSGKKAQGGIAWDVAAGTEHATEATGDA